MAEMTKIPNDVSGTTQKLLESIVEKEEYVIKQEERVVKAAEEITQQIEEHTRNWGYDPDDAIDEALEEYPSLSRENDEVVEELEDLVHYALANLEQMGIQFEGGKFTADAFEPKELETYIFISPGVDILKESKEAGGQGLLEFIREEASSYNPDEVEEYLQEEELNTLGRYEVELVELGQEIEVCIEEIKQDCLELLGDVDGAISREIDVMLPQRLKQRCEQSLEY